MTTNFVIESWRKVFLPQWAMRFLTNIEVSRQQKALRHVPHDEHTIEVEATEEHNIDAAESTEHHLMKILDGAAHAAFWTEFWLEELNLDVLKAIHKLVDAWKKIEKIRKEINDATEKSKLDDEIQQVEEEFGRLMHSALIEVAEKDERSIYHQLLALLDENAEDHKDFAMAVQTFMKDMDNAPSILARIAMKKEIKRVYHDDVKIKAFARETDTIIRHMEDDVHDDNPAANIRRALGHLRTLAHDSEKVIIDAFRELYKLKRLEFTFLAFIILHLERIVEENKEWVKKHLIPETLHDEIGDDAHKIRDYIYKQFHMIAQANKIVIRDLDKIDEKATHLPKAA